VKADDEISRGIFDLLLREPFFGHLLGSIVRVVSSTETKTAGVGIRDSRVHLLVNPTFFVDTLRTKPERVAVLKHEVLHLAFKHVTRRPKDKDPSIWNLAADLVVNQHVGKPWKLPADAVTLASFKDLALPPDQTVDWYYDKLVAAGVAPRADWHSDHSAFGEEGDSPLADLLADRLLTQTADRVGASVWSTLPGPLRALVQAALVRREPEVDWRRALRLFSSSSRRTRIVSTKHRASRRYGTFPGIRVERRHRIAVAIDTSGSVTDEHLGAFFSEIHSIWRQGAEVHVIECDAAVQRVYPYRGALPRGVAGRGGTAFDPVFEFLRDERRTRWDACVYLTDGVAREPSIPPPCRLLWVVTPHGSVDALRFGRAVKLSYLPNVNPNRR
jgi:predicted metal-dependent peptidase